MALTVAEMTTEVRALINEESASFWSDTEIENWIKQGTIDISCKLLSAEQESTITLATNQWIYTSSDESWIGDLLRSKDVYFTDSSGNIYGLQRIRIKNIGHLEVKQTANRPKYFVEVNRKFYVWPKPSSNENGQDLTVVHAYETDDATALKDEHQHLVILFAAARAKTKDRAFNDAALMMQEYRSGIQFERQDKYDFGVDPTEVFRLR